MASNDSSRIFFAGLDASTVSTPHNDVQTCRVKRDQLLEQGRFKEVVDESTKLLQLLGASPSGKNTTEYASTLALLAHAQERLGNPDEALATIERAIEIQKSKLGLNHSSVAESFRIQGKIFSKMGRSGPLRLPAPQPLCAASATVTTPNPKTSYTGLHRITILRTRRARLTRPPETLVSSNAIQVHGRSGQAARGARHRQALEGREGRGICPAHRRHRELIQHDGSAAIAPLWRLDALEPRRGGMLQGSTR